MILWGGTLSPAPVEHRLFAAARAGFHAMSVAPMDFGPPDRILQRADSVAKLANRLNIFVACIDPVTSWPPPPVQVGSIPTANSAQRCYGDLFGRYSVSKCLRLAERLGSTTISAIEPYGVGFGHQLVVDSFSALCESAADRGHTIQLEPMPFSSIFDLATAHRIVADSSAKNAGIVFDSWHFDRSGGTQDQLRALPRGIVTSIQLNDGRRSEAEDLWEEASTQRLLPGEGSFGIAESIDALAGRLADSTLIGPEVISADHRLSPVNYVAQIAYDACLPYAQRAGLDIGPV
ncbi:xylose isomerase domain-containing protein [Rhodococcus opacus M213]|uniref:Xylose isomerase domain-containing protein n=1 Tax=Rhodococcus opacus M213 TaxID=1129896 RepID=K8XBE3_RHOOP|nr:sugar phosphate isomerase/epimerase [Rhodococcus opacus]EKT78764.1 xylose isomerase domain-containing protein [Rhodococcus opacus M213]